MTDQYLSHFGPDIAAFVRQQQAVGWPYVTSQQKLASFDRFCAKHYPEEQCMTRSLIMHWAERRPEEHVNTLIRRITPLRQFAKYLNGQGIAAYVIPSGIPAKGIRYVPHIYTASELTAFFYALDQCAYDPHSPTRHWVIPVMFRVLYCCGLRVSEVARLTIDDVDLTTGTLMIRQSKGHKDRRVMLALDVLELCRTYHQQVGRCWPQRTAFFPNHRGQHYSHSGLDYTFHMCWNRAGIGPVSGNSPRMHDFRHSFAVHRLNQWVQEKKDLSAYLPYLTMYLGHEHLTETDYYLHLVPEFFPVLTDAIETRFGALIPEVTP